MMPTSSMAIVRVPITTPAFNGKATHTHRSTEITTLIQLITAFKARAGPPMYNVTLALYSIPIFLFTISTKVLADCVSRTHRCTISTRTKTKRHRFIRSFKPCRYNTRQVTTFVGTPTTKITGIRTQSDMVTIFLYVS